MSQQNLNIDTLLDQCKEGSTTAQLEVYRRYQKAMYNVALRIVNNEEEAEDIMQESFLAAFTKLHSFSGQVAFGSWLKKIVINQSLHSYQKMKKQQMVGLDSILYRVEESPAISEDTQNETTQLAQKVMRVMGTLKENYRVALTLYLIEGYDHEEISELMNLSYSNCRTTISRAKESLRKKMTQMG